MGTLTVGVSFADIKGFPNDRYVSYGRNLGRVCVTHGGVCRNVTEDLVHIGEEVTFLSLCDKSPIGRDLMQHLEDEGVDLSHVVSVENSGVGMWLVILNDSGDLAGSISQMPDVAPLEAYIHDNCEELVREADSVVLEMDVSVSIVSDILSAAEKYGKKVYALVANMSIVLTHPEYLSSLDCFICNEIEAGRLFESEDVFYSPNAMLEVLPDELAKRGIPAMVITMGPQGAVYYDSRTGESGHCPTLATELVDTSGAGDAFLAGFVAARNHGHSLPDSVRAASRLAAMALAQEESVAPKVKNFFELSEN